MTITDLIPIPTGINVGLRAARNSTMLQLFGSPRSSFGTDCQPITHPDLKTRIVTRSVGPFRVTGLDRGVESLTAVMADVGAELPHIHDELGSAGMLCCRLVRGSQSAISNHSWGTAIDLTLSGLPVDQRGDDLCQRGLADIAPVFNRHGWFWGAGFRTEDAMHFELSEEKLQELFPGGGGGTPPLLDAISFGDRGPEVRRLQERLRDNGFSLVIDGIFGVNTLAAVRAFQGANGLLPDGVVGPKTSAALGLA